MDVTVEDLRKLLPVPIDPGAESRVKALIDSAIEKIKRVFLKEGRDFDAEILRVPWLSAEARDIVLEMVAAAVMMGDNAGVRSASSTTGPQSDSITYAHVDAVNFSGVRLTTAMLEALGLIVGGPLFIFPPARGWPEVEAC